MEAQLVLQAGAGACEGELPHFLMGLREAKPGSSPALVRSSLSQMQVQVLQCAIHMGLVAKQVVPLLCCSALLQGN